MKLTTIGDRFRIDEAVRINKYTVPEGFVTDFASIPRWALSFLGSPTCEKYRRASLLHDYLIDHIDLPMGKIHRLFFATLIEDEVPIIRALVMYLAVKWFYKKFAASRAC
jgi:hypothetical protein